MKRLCTLLLLVGPLAGCFPVRSEQFACTVDEDCSSGRHCEQSFCVLTSGTGVADAPPKVADSEPSATCNTDWPDKPSLVDPCQIDEPGDALTLTMTGATGYVLDSSGGTLKAPDGSPVVIASSNVGGILVVSTDGFTLGSGTTLHVIGSAPVAIASWSTITVDGVIDAGSTSAQTGGVTDQPGAGADVTAGCSPGTLPTATGNNGDGGGGGGSFGGPGGAGGAGGQDNGGAAGVAGGVKAATTLGAGCPGQAGAGTGPGLGGAGGGAIALVAKTSITIGGTGVVAAGGAGGHYSTGTSGNENVRPGGGGGGSGGMIWLESPTVTSTGTLTANGGGGGQGRDNDRDGAPGVNAGKLLGSVLGGRGATNGGGWGGAGGSQATPPVPGNRGDRTNQDTGDTGGGGGGGGGLGVISVTSASGSLGTLTSPTPVTHVPNPG